MSSSLGEREFISARNTELHIENVAMNVGEDGKPIFTITSKANNKLDTSVGNRGTTVAQSLHDGLVQEANDRLINYKNNYDNSKIDLKKDVGREVSFDEYVSMCSDSKSPLYKDYYMHYKEDLQNGFIKPDMSFDDYVYDKSGLYRDAKDYDTLIEKISVFRSVLG